MIHWPISASADHFWRPAELENVSNLDFENLKHLKNRGNVSLNEGCITTNNNPAYESSLCVEAEDFFASAVV